MKRIKDILKISALLLLGIFVLLFLTLPGFRTLVIPEILNRYAVNNFTGFWEGPHPEEKAKKFYLQVVSEQDSLQAKGFWTERGFYLSEFGVDSLHIEGRMMSFFVPGWGCRYEGILKGNGWVQGGFSCGEEAFDPVTLAKNDQIQDVLIHARPGCQLPDYAYRYRVPDPLHGGPEVSGRLSVGDSLFIYALLPEIIAGDYGRINSFLVYRHGQLVCEEYFFGYAKEDLHPIESCTKSIASLLIGLALDQGMLKDLDDPLYTYFPDYPHLKAGLYPKLNLRNLLSMTSGFDPMNDALFASDDRIDFALKRPLLDTPGEVFRYDGGNSEILGAVLQAATGEFADSFARRTLFQPLDIDRYDWDRFRQQGFPSMGGSLHLTPRAMTKIGVMVLQNGGYQGKQVVSGQWIGESTTPRTETHTVERYAYHWWNLELGQDPQRYQAIWANGWGGQFIYIIPQLETVIVTTGHNYELDSWAITQGISKYIHSLDTDQNP